MDDNLSYKIHPGDELLVFYGLIKKSVSPSLLCLIFVVYADKNSEITGFELI